MDTICYIGGVGRLGLPLAAWSASRGFRVFCIDVNEEAIEVVRNGESPNKEPLVESLVQQQIGKNLFATTEYGAILESELSFVIVPTPSKEDGSFSIEHVLDVCGKIGAALRQRDGYHVVVIVSTVMPGDTGGYIRDALEEASGKKAGVDFGLAYSPEFVRQGSVVNDFANPDQVLIGALDEKSGSVVGQYYDRIVEGTPPIRQMSLVSAEIAKIGLSAAVVTKMAMANNLAWMCHGFPGADAQDVLVAVGGDSRIGSKYFKAGTWPGGPRLPRDILAFIAAVGKGPGHRMMKEIGFFSARQAAILAQNVIQLAGEDGVVGICGLTYKPDIDIIEESQGLLLARLIRSQVSTVLICDPVLEQRGDMVYSLDETVEKSDLLVLMTCHPEFKQLEEMDLEGKTILDMWGFIDEGKVNCEYIRFGRERDAGTTL